MNNVGVRNVKIKSPIITPSTKNPAVLMGLKLAEQNRKKKAQEQKQSAEKKPKEKPAPIWAIDFDGTLAVGNHFPNIGKPNVNLIELLKMAKVQGVRLILWISREGHYLNDALEWCKDQGLEFDAVNDNLPEIIEMYGGNSRKVTANLFIDDRAFHFWGEEGEKRLWQLVQNL